MTTGRAASTILDPTRLGSLELPNRIVMAPLTRARAGTGDVPTDLNATYYAQRAGFGLIVSEGTNISARSCSFECTPGLWSDAQVIGWANVTRAVHARGGRIFAQLWHCGRIGAAGLLNGAEPLSPSGVNDDLEKLGVYGLLKNGNYVPLMATPSREMTLTEIRQTINEYRSAAANAMRAGFDGVEIHGANGYLPHQFLSPTINRRTDEYGGSIANRARFLAEVFEAIAHEVPPSRIGLRVSPYATYNNTRDPDPATTYAYVAKLMDRLGAGYLHFADMNGWFGAPDLPKILEALRPNYRGPIIANGGISPQQARDLVIAGNVQLVAFGRYAIANPDLVERMRSEASIAEARYEGWYATGAVGYTDYPTLAGT
jgi:N-ethylmaleimide reductase